MAGIFISYRREDTGELAHRLHDALTARFGTSAVFIDVVDIDAGEDFTEVIESKVGFSDVLVTLIGKKWSSCTDAAGRRRLDDPRDWVRLEIGAALARDIRVVPVLVDDARLPAAADLPAPLDTLPTRQALPLRTERFARDIERLGAALEKFGVGRVGVSWLAVIARRHRALDPVDLGRPEVIRRSLLFLLLMGLATSLIRLAAGPALGEGLSRALGTIADALTSAGEWLVLGVFLHIAMKVLGGQGILARSVAATCFLSAFLPLFALSLAPAWGLSISIITEVPDPKWSLAQAIDAMTAHYTSLGAFAMTRVVLSEILSSVLLVLMLNGLFQSLRTLHRLRVGRALAAAALAGLAYVAFLLFLWTPLLGQMYTVLDVAPDAR